MCRMIAAWKLFHLNFSYNAMPYHLQCSPTTCKALQAEGATIARLTYLHFNVSYFDESQPDIRYFPNPPSRTRV